MAEAIRMPLLSDTMKEGVIAEWHKKVGDKVKSDDVIADVETDKATMEVMPYVDGTLLYIGIEKGQAAKINQIIAIIGKEGEDYKSLLEGDQNSDSSKENESKDKEEKTEDNTETILVEESKEEPKEKTETPVSEEKKENGPQDQQVSQQTEAPAKEKEESTSEKEQPQQTEEKQAEGARIKASPLAKKLAEDKGINIKEVAGSGDGGRIIKRDVDSHKPPAKSEEKKEPAKQQGTVIPFAAAGQEGHTDHPLSQMRKVIAERLVESKFSSPHFYLRMTVVMDNAIAARNAINEIAPVKISFNDLIIKACAMALRKHPEVNTSWMGEFLRQNQHIHIGSAVAIDEGLIVPVIKFADQKSLSQIAEESKALAEKARNKKLQPPEFTGNTFTISNLGMMDMDEFTAIINPPDSCILAVGKITPTPVVVENNEVVVKQLLKLTLSCDHRVVDGAVGARFLQTLKAHLENPVTMLV